MEQPKWKTHKLRDCISVDENETAVFAADVLAQPNYRQQYRKVDPLVHLKCSRALPIANADDIVVLSAPVDEEYYQWLRSLDMGPEHVVTYQAEDPATPLAELVVLNPEPLRETIWKTRKSPVYVPFYSSERAEQAAQAVDAQLFGCDEQITLKYFNKESFKEECMNLGIRMINGSCHKRTVMEARELEVVVSNLLDYYPSLIIRGSLGSAGSSVYYVDNHRLLEVLQQIEENQDSELLIEPFLQVIASPNDQWVVDREGQVIRIGVTAQLFEGLKHVGNLRGQYFSKRVYEYIVEVSQKIVIDMAARGYRGFLGIDYIVSLEGIFPIENNARMNGSSFTIGIVDKLEQRLGPISYWKFYKAVTTPCSFRELLKRIEPVLYHGTNMNSVFPYDCDALSRTGIFAPVIVAEDMYHIEFLETALEQLGVRKI